MATWQRLTVRILAVSGFTALMGVCVPSPAQSMAMPSGPAAGPVGDDGPGYVLPNAPHPRPAYQEPTESAKLHDYLSNAYGPLTLTEGLFMSGIHQATRNPPDWQEGMAGFGERLGSDFGISTVQITARYAIAEVAREDTRYYRCNCTGFFPRLGHAVVSTLIARRGADGHATFSYANLLAPYVGTTTAVYGWYPSRYGIKDAFRMGNYSLMGYMGCNLSLEFLPHGAHSLQARLHLTNRHGAPEPGD